MQGNKNMETIMSQIKEHILPTVDYGANGNIHHYNRVWEKIEEWASATTNTQIPISSIKVSSECVCKKCGRGPYLNKWFAYNCCQY